MGWTVDVNHGPLLSKRGSRDDLENGFDSSRSASVESRDGAKMGGGRKKLKTIFSGKGGGRNGSQGSGRIPLKRQNRLMESATVHRYQMAAAIVLIIFLTYRAYIAPQCSCNGGRAHVKPTMADATTLSNRTTAGQLPSTDTTVPLADESIPKVSATRTGPSSGTGARGKIGGQSLPSLHEHVAPTASSVTINKSKLVFYGQEGGGQHQPDKIAYESFFKSYPLVGEGFFVEVGAQDGFQRSNTRFFEESLSWRGLLIEGATPNVQALLGHAKRRPQSTIVGKAVCKVSGTTKFIGDGGTAGMTSMLPKGHRERWSSFWKEEWQHDYEVPCAPLHEILSEENVKKIDFLSVDVSGAEALVIQTLDYQAANVRVLVVELGHSHVDEQAREVLTTNGFCLAMAVAQNEFWTSDVDLKARYCR